MLEEEELQIKDKCDYYRRKEDMLVQINQKIGIYEGQDKFEDIGASNSQNHRDALLKELQADYDRYLKTYQLNKLRKIGAQATTKEEVRKYENLNLQSRWADYLNSSETDSLDPMSFIDK